MAQTISSPVSQESDISQEAGVESAVNSIA